MTLYPYQQRVKSLVLQGKSVVVQAPTGAGKTRAALAPFIESFFEGDSERFPSKCIYSIPMRVLANQFREEYGALAASYTRRFRPNQELGVRIQTGERAEDPRFLGGLIFATIDQTLSSALAVPYSLSARMGNMNAGAFYSSYLVFDEFHLFPVDERGGASGALVTTLQLLSEIKGIVPFVLMTATFSSTMLNELANRLDAEVVTVPQDEYRRIATGSGKSPRRRIYHVHEQTVSADAVLTTHSEKGVSRSIIICNQVARAQELYRALRDHPGRGNTEIRLLHSRFTQEDRQGKEDEVRKEFGKNSQERAIDSLILVSTQVIEVGLDITCDRLHTEIAPANAIFQRAGRCARFPGEIGHVHVYQAPLRKSLSGEEAKPDFLPYPAALSLAAWQSFGRRNGQELDFQDEQTIVDEVHTQADRALLEAMDQQRGLIRRSILNAMESHDRSYRQELIRRIDSVIVLAAKQPKDVGNPFTAQGFSLFRGSIYGIWRDLEAFADDYDPGEFAERLWTMQYPVPVDGGNEDATQEERYAWYPIDDPDLITNTAVIVVNSAFCAYDDELGFRILSPSDETGWTSAPGQVFQGNRISSYSYRLESYAEHITSMIHVYQREFRDDYAYMQRRLAEAWNLPKDGLDRAIRLAIACHDVGKMDRRWQRWVRLYQSAIGRPIDDPEFMAVHTDFDPTNATHREAKKRADRQISRPRHAGESAVAAAKIVATQFNKWQDIARAVLTSVARHHSTTTAEYQRYELHEGAEKAVSEAILAALLPTSNLPLRSAGQGGPLGKILIQPEEFQSLLLYLYVVRVLRLCDGMSQEKK